MWCCSHSRRPLRLVPVTWCPHSATFTGSNGLRTAGRSAWPLLRPSVASVGTSAGSSGTTGTCTMPPAVLLCPSVLTAAAPDCSPAVVEGAGDTLAMTASLGSGAAGHGWPLSSRQHCWTADVRAWQVGSSIVDLHAMSTGCCAVQSTIVLRHRKASRLSSSAQA